jgi:GAF domain-containing protein
VDKYNRSPSFLERLLARWGGAYIYWMQLLILVFSSTTSAVGVYYIISAANLNNDQISKLIFGLCIFITLSHILIAVYAAFSTSTARARLDLIIKTKPMSPNLSQEVIETTSWQEIHTLPSRIGLVEAATVIIVVVIPIIIFMRWIGGVDVSQSVHIAIGTLYAGGSILILNILLLERMLVPVRQTLISSTITSKTFPQHSSLRLRLLGIFIFMVISIAIMLSGIDFQKFINTSMPGADLTLEIASFQKQTVILGMSIIAIGLLFGSLIAQSISLPIVEINRTLERAQMGDLTVRANILASDETSSLTLQLNQLLNQLQVAQTNLEMQVEERTADLNRRTSQLQTAARLSHDTSEARDLQTLLTRTVNLVSDHFGYYHVGIFLTDATGDYAILQAASSEGGKKMMARGYKLEIGQHGIVGLAAYENSPQIVTNVFQDTDNQENSDLPGTKSQIAIPLAPRGKVVGVLDIQSVDQAAFSTDEKELLQTLADQIALAILNVQLIEENRFALDQMEAVLSENVRRAWSDRSREQKRSYRYTPTGLTTLQSIEIGEFPSGESASQFSIPITLRGEKIGNIRIQRKGENTWSDTDRSLVAEVANQIGLALENSRLLQDAQQSAYHEQTLSDLTAKLGRSVDTDNLLQTTVRELHHLPNVTEVSVYLIPPENENPVEKA